MLHPYTTLFRSGLGTHPITVTATDGAGNSATCTTSFTVGAQISASEPRDATLCLGQHAGFATAAGGTGPFDYQWRLDGNAAGTNGPSLTVPTAGLSSGDHTVAVVVGGPCGLAVTNTATLRVQDSFAANGPAGVAVCPGTDASFVTEPSGT